MKRVFALITAGGLTTAVSLVMFIAILSAATDSGNPQPVGAAAPVEASLAAQPDPPAWEMNTSNSVEFDIKTNEEKIEAIIQERETTLQAQVSERQAALSDLDQTAQAQIARLKADLVGRQPQIDQIAANIESLQGHAAALQKTIQTDEATYQSELSAMAAVETQLGQTLEMALAQLNAAYAEIDQQQVPVNASNGSDGHQDSVNNPTEHYDDDDERDHDEHDDDRDDDDDHGEDDD